MRHADSRGSLISTDSVSSLSEKHNDKGNSLDKVPQEISQSVFHVFELLLICETAFKTVQTRSICSISDWERCFPETLPLKSLKAYFRLWRHLFHSVTAPRLRSGNELLAEPSLCRLGSSAKLSVPVRKKTCLFYHLPFCKATITATVTTHLPAADIRGCERLCRSFSFSLGGMKLAEHRPRPAV